MPVTSYSTLKAAIETWSKRADVSTSIDDFIDLAESEMWRYLRIRDMETRATASASTSSKYLALPDGYIEMRRLTITSGSTNYDCAQRTPETMLSTITSGIPVYFTVTSQLEFDRTPDAAYTVTMQYYKSLTALSSSNTSNAVLSRFPSIYLYGALWFLNDWALNAERSAYYQQLFMQAIESANAQDRSGRYGPAPVMNYQGVMP